MAMPTRAKRKKQYRAPHSAAVPTMIARFSVPSMRSPKRSTSPANGTSRSFGWLPQAAPATPRKTKPRPIVSISTAKGGSPIIGRSSTRSSSMPTAAMIRTVARKPGTKPHSSTLMNVKAM